MHSAIAETIPELLVEARQEVQAEMEQAAMTEASAAMQQLVEQGQIDPTEAEMQLQSKATKETAGQLHLKLKNPKVQWQWKLSPGKRIRRAPPQTLTQNVGLKEGWLHLKLSKNRKDLCKKEST